MYKRQVKYTHEKYKANDNYNCNYKNYSEYYHKRQMKKPLTAVQVGLLNQTSDERIEKEQSICNERKRGDFVWPTGKIKKLPYEQVTSTIKTNVAAIQWNFNEAGMKTEILIWRLLYYATEEQYTSGRRRTMQLL